MSRIKNKQTTKQKKTVQWLVKGLIYELREDSKPRLKTDHRSGTKRSRTWVLGCRQASLQQEQQEDVDATTIHVSVHWHKGEKKSPFTSAHFSREDNYVRAQLRLTWSLPRFQTSVSMQKLYLHFELRSTMHHNLIMLNYDISPVKVYHAVPLAAIDLSANCH